MATYSNYLRIFLNAEPQKLIAQLLRALIDSLIHIHLFIIF